MAILRHSEQVFRGPTLVEGIEDAISRIQVFSKDIVSVTCFALVEVRLAGKIELNKPTLVVKRDSGFTKVKYRHYRYGGLYLKDKSRSNDLR